jgi:linoleoyl-CoA desaturase
MTGGSHYANRKMWLKILFWAVVWSGTWLMAVVSDVSLPFRIAFGFLHILSHILIALNIAHDANHSALSPRRWVNQLVSFSFDLVGGSSLAWRLTHNYSHHGFVNVEGLDAGADGRGIVRFTSNAPWKPLHRYQHLYSPVLYCFVVLNVIFNRDFQVLFSFYKSRKFKIPLWEIAAFFAFKIFYFTYVLLIPWLILPYSFFSIFAVFVLSQLVVGQFLIFIQMGHLNEFAEFPAANGDQSGTSDIDVLSTTCDFGASNKLGSWLLGGINIHTVHHLRPDICHVHYRELLPIVIETAREFGIPYVSEDRILRGYTSHYRLLKMLGQPN